MLMSYFLRGCPKRQTGEKERGEGKRSFPQKSSPPPFFSLRASLPPQNFWVNFMQLTASLFSSLLLSLAISCSHILLLRREQQSWKSSMIVALAAKKKPTTIFSYKITQNSIDNPWLVSCKYPSDVVSRYAYHRMLDAMHVHYSLRDLVHPSPSAGRIKKGQRRMGNEYPGGVRPTPFFARPLPPDEIEHGRWIIIRRPRPKPPPPQSLVASLREMLLFCWSENRQRWKPEFNASNVFDSLWRNSRRPLPAVRASPIPPSVYIL